MYSFYHFFRFLCTESKIDFHGGSREALYTSLSEKGNPSFSTVFNILRSMGITLQARQTISA